MTGMYVLAGIFVLLAVGIAGGLWHAGRDRRLTHAERMKALELGRPMPGEPQPKVEPAPEPASLASRQCFSTALWIAFWGFLGAGGTAGMQLGVSIAIAVATGMIGVTAFICGTILAAREQAIAAAAHSAPVASHKLHVADADAFDVVSRRG